MRFIVTLLLSSLLLTACASSMSHDEIQASFDAGLKQYDAQDYAGAYATWSKLDGYDVAAMRNVALMLRKGQGVDNDPKAALEMMARAADMGLATAQADLGEMLVNGEGCKPDPKAALPWLTRAAAAGHPIAAYELAGLLEAGTAGSKDLETARALYRQAAAAGMEAAAKHLTEMPPPPKPADKNPEKSTSPDH